MLELTLDLMVENAPDRREREKSQGTHAVLSNDPGCSKCELGAHIG